MHSSTISKPTFTFLGLERLLPFMRSVGVRIIDQI